MEQERLRGISVLGKLMVFIGLAGITYGIVAFFLTLLGLILTKSITRSFNFEGLSGVVKLCGVLAFICGVLSLIAGRGVLK